MPKSTTYLNTQNTGERYWFGFNGQESENEIWGEGNASFYKYRISDNRLGRFFSVDPLAAQYPHNSTYAFSENRVIDGVEMEGLEVLLVGKTVSGAVGLAGSIEGGIAISFREGKVAAYGTWGLGIESDISIATQVTSVLFLTMNKLSDLEGLSGNVSVSTAKYGPTLSGGVVLAGDHIGFAFSYGFGAGIAPGSLSVTISKTYLDSKNTRINKLETLGLLYNALEANNNERLKLMNEQSSLMLENLGVMLEMAAIKNKINAGVSSDIKNKLTERYSNLQEQMNITDTKINEYKTALNDLNQTGTHIIAAINDLEDE